MTINAASVSRFLGGRGWNRYEWVASAAVRGWGYGTTGFKCEESFDFDRRPAVKVLWILGESSRLGLSPTQGRALVKKKVLELSDELSVRYSVVREFPDQVFGGDPYLMVTARKEEKS